MRNYITDPLPTSLIIDGAEYPIYTDFRAVLHYDHIIRDEKEDGSELEEAIRFLFCERIPVDHLDSAIEQINWFVQCGETEKRHRPSKSILGINNEKPMDYEIDSMLIWSAFRRVYGIDLREIPYLHWWDFQAMLGELPDDVRLSRIIEMRTRDVNNKKLTKEERTLYRELQRYYKIKDMPSEKQERLLEALRNGEDPTPYL